MSPLGGKKKKKKPRSALVTKLLLKYDVNKFISQIHVRFWQLGAILALSPVVSTRGRAYSSAPVVRTRACVPAQP